MASGSKIDDELSRTNMPIQRAIMYALDSVEMRMQGIECAIPYLVGTPGGGKTQMTNKFALERGYNFISASPALERVEKFGGIPDLVHMENGDLHTVWSVPRLICEIRKVSENGKPTVVLLDDWHLCPEEIQQIGFELFTYHSLNGHKIPENAQFILAGNETSAAGARVQLSAIRNRCVNYRVFSDPEYWIDNYAAPKGIHDIGISFFSSKDHFTLFHEEEATSHQFGSPRSWTHAFIQLTWAENNEKYHAVDPRTKKTGLPIADLQAILEGSVSKKAAAKFIEYYRIYREVNATKIFDTGKYVIPEKNINRFAFASAICAEFYHRFTSGKRKKEAAHLFVSIMNDLQTHSREIAVKTLRTIAKKPKVEEFDKIKGAKAYSGAEILTEIIKAGILDLKLVDDLRQTVALLNADK